MSDDGEGRTYTRKRYHHGGGFVHATNVFARTVNNTDAVAIWLRLYSHADGWEFTVKSIAADWDISFKRAETAIKLLRDLGYCHFCRASLGRGKFESWYDLTDVPVLACGEPKCVDCAARATTPVTDPQNQPPDTTSADTPIAAGRIGCADYGVRKPTTHIEDHPLEDQEDQDQNKDDEPNPGSSSSSGIATRAPDYAEAQGRDEPGYRDDVDRICEHLASRLGEWMTRRPTILKAWRTEARLMLDRDNFTEQQVHYLIDWCQDSTFWRPNIQGLPKLRKQAQTLVGQIRREREQRSPASRPPTTDLRVQAGRELTARYEAEEAAREGRAIGDGTRDGKPVVAGRVL